MSGESKRIHSIFSNVTSGIITAVLTISINICVATFIFSGDKLSAAFPTGLALTFLSSIIVGLLLLIGGTYTSTISTAAIVPAALIAVLAQKIVSTNIPVDDILPTVLMSIFLISLITGVIFYLMGTFKLGKLGRFIPYPVMGGFLASVGWLLVSGSINVMRRTSLPIENQFDGLFNPATLQHVIPGVIFALILIILSRYIKHYLFLPVSIIVAIAGFYGFFYYADFQNIDAANLGWVMSSFSNNEVWTNHLNFSNVRWDILLSNFSTILVILAVTIISILLTIAGVESAVDTEIDLDKDLKWSGIGNIFSGLMCCVVAHHSLPFTKINFQSGSRSRLGGLICVLICLLVAILSISEVVSFFPKPILGGLLMFFGFGLMIEWLFSSWFRLNLIEYCIILLIFITIIFSNFLYGVLLGLVLSALLFVIQYMRISIVKHIFSGSSKRSNVARSLDKQDILSEHGNKTYIIVLQGYIFFGTAHGLYQTIKKRITDTSLVTPTHIILDFKLVNGLDSSAFHSLSKIIKLNNTYNSKLLFSNMSDSIKGHFQNSGAINQSIPSDSYDFYSDLDLSLEHCENELLNEINSESLKPQTINDRLMFWFSDQNVVNQFQNYLEKRNCQKDEWLFHQGDASDCIYILEKGQASIYLELIDGKTKRLAKVEEGSVVGEMGVYRNEIRSASFRSDTDCSFYILSASNLEKMKIEHPNIAAIFHKFVACLLSDRLSHSNAILSEM
ncbi:hypothetical protein DID75_00630 [Candidatus Marinamargulisbacteria bacterium SCGC AG-410-N11]|nr:hypothetical protein DID75_00630 [Candidatus Marinamargulisbacteria bacterium SCGC AG-410-N11]